MSINKKMILTRAEISPALHRRLRIFAVEYGATIPDVIGVALDKYLPEYPINKTDRRIQGAKPCRAK